MGAFERAGYPTRPGPYLEEWFREAGFVDIHVHKYLVPMGSWAKDPYYKKVGTWMFLNAVTGFRAAAIAVLTRYESWKPEEVEVLATQAVKDAKNPKIHALIDL
ncbi:hypothetical protein VTN77DRAFT_7666 [Rasamsonia byssochlamydoides]|uniref:uncharacterized protein n=1 Tax=Rasamsonia byssochlamydoides TaxID=89139 RepID=UPI0037427677